MKYSTIREVEKLEAAMAADPPVIQWVLCQRRRVMVAAHVYDKHTDVPVAGRGLRKAS